MKWFFLGVALAAFLNQVAGLPIGPKGEFWLLNLNVMLALGFYCILHKIECRASDRNDN